MSSEHVEQYECSDSGWLLNRNEKFFGMLPFMQSKNEYCHHILSILLK